VEPRADDRRVQRRVGGFFGLKPTRGRNSLGPLFGDFAHGIVCEHALTRSVRDSAALLDATSGPAPGEPYSAPPAERPFLEETRRNPGRLRIACLTRVPDGWNEETALHPDCAEAVQDAARLCESLGHTVEEADPVALAWADLPRLFLTVFESFVGHAVAYWERVLGKTVAREDLEPVTWDLYQESRHITSAAYLVTWEELQRFSRKVACWYDDGGWDVLLSPTMRIPPTALGSFDPSPDDPGRSVRIALSFVAFTRTQNITGDPAMGGQAAVCACRRGVLRGGAAARLKLCRDRPLAAIEAPPGLRALHDDILILGICHRKNVYERFGLRIH